jgi:hypothetical protein
MCPASLAQHAKAAHKLAVAQSVCQRTGFSFPVRLASPNLFSTFKPLTLTRVSLVRLKPLLHDNAGKATRRFLPNFSAIPQKLCLACLSKIYHAFWQRRQNQILKNQVDGSPTNATVRCAGAIHQ